MSGLQAIWLVAAFFIGFYFIEIIAAFVKVSVSFLVNVIFGLLGVLVAYTVMFA